MGAGFVRSQASMVSRVLKMLALLHSRMLDFRVTLEPARLHRSQEADPFEAPPPPKRTRAVATVRLDKDFAEDWDTAGKVMADCLATSGIELPLATSPEMLAKEMEGWTVEWELGGSGEHVQEALYANEAVYEGRRAQALTVENNQGRAEFHLVTTPEPKQRHRAGRKKRITVPITARLDTSSVEFVTELIVKIVRGGGLLGGDPLERLDLLIDLGVGIYKGLVKPEAKAELEVEYCDWPGWQGTVSVNAAASMNIGMGPGSGVKKAGTSKIVYRLYPDGRATYQGSAELRMEVRTRVTSAVGTGENNWKSTSEGAGSGDTTVSVHLEESGAYTLTLGPVTVPLTETATSYGNLPELLGVDGTATQSDTYTFDGGDVAGDGPTEPRRLTGRKTLKRSGAELGVKGATESIVVEWALSRDD